MISALRHATLLIAALAMSCGAFAQANYKIMPGDLVEVGVFQEKDLSGSFRVSGDGMINMPLIGAVRIAGSGETSAASLLRNKLLDGYLVDPQVTVRVTDYAKLSFTVLGQVRDARAYTITGEEEITLLEAIGKAGGFTRLANERKVLVKRRVAGAIKILRFDAKAMASDGSDSDFVIRDGDVITVSESKF